MLGSSAARFACPFLLALASACITVPDQEGAAAGSDTAPETKEKASKPASAKAGAAADKKAAAKKKSLREQVEEKEEALAKLERELHYAQLELQIATKKGASDEVAADLARDEAQRALDDAKRALTAFDEITRPLSDAEAKLSVDRAERRVTEAREELAGILAIYAEETEAVSKDEVIRRHERSVDFAVRGHEIAEKKVEAARQTDLEPKRRKLSWAAEKAEITLAQTSDANDRKRISTELELLKKEHALEAKQREIKKAEKALSKLKTALKKQTKAAAEKAEKKAAAKAAKEEK